MLLLLSLVAVVASQPSDYNINLQRVMNDERLFGMVAGMILTDSNIDETMIIGNIQRCLGDFCPAEQRIREIIGRVHAEALAGPIPLPLPPTAFPTRFQHEEIPDERLRIAQHNLNEYQNDPHVLNRIVAIDESWIVWTHDIRQQIIAAYARDRIVAFMFLSEGNSLTSQDMLRFLNMILAPTLININLNQPIIMMDNLRAHFTSEVLATIHQRQWTLWRQPRYSADMMPLDTDGFRTIRQRLREYCFRTTEEARLAIESAINEVNSLRLLNGISELPDIWHNVIARRGHRQNEFRSSPPPPAPGSPNSRQLRALRTFMALDNSKCHHVFRSSTGYCIDNNATQIVSFGCRNGFCWSSCPNKQSQNPLSYCFTIAVDNSSTPHNDPFVTCQKDSDCDPCWGCAFRCKQINSVFM